MAKSEGRKSAERMLPIVCAAGYTGSDRNFRRLFAEAKALCRNEHHRWRRPAVWAPDEYPITDGAQAAPGSFLSCAVLAFARWGVRRVRDRSAGRHHRGPSVTHAAGGYALSGFIQRSPGNRMKSVSAEASSTPCSTARAASCASGTRLPVISTCSHSLL